MSSIIKFPSVSILLPTYRDAPRLMAAIESVRAQTFSDWELLIIDDGLAEAPLEIIGELLRTDPRIKYFKNKKNSGIQQSLNNGLRQAKGKYVARIDDDDVWINSEKLAKQISFLEQNSDYVLVGTNAVLHNERGDVLGAYALPETDEAIRMRMLSKNCFIHPSIVARMSAIEAVGGYRESERTKHIEDYALWLELGLIGKFANLNERTVQLTAHAQSITFTNRYAQARRMRALIWSYRKKYPRFYAGYFILTVRVAGFAFLKAVPLPAKLLYLIQSLYKNF